MLELGEYKDNYESIISDEENETNTSKIYKGYNKIFKRFCFLKVKNKEQLKLGDYDFLMEQIKREEELTKLFNSENIVKLYQKLETKENIIFELEYCNEEMKTYIKTNGELKNDKKFFKQIIISLAKALKIIHSKGVMHRDIKPSNIFYLKKSEHSSEKIIKLGDFGCSIYIKDNTSDPIGTILYAAPEIIKNIEYDEKCDLWSLGVSLYELYFGVLPYGPEPNTNIIMDTIYDEENFRLKKTYIPTLDILFNKLIIIDPKKRMDFDDFFELVFNENFMEKDFVFPKYKEIYDIICKNEDVEYKFIIKKEAFNKEEQEKENAKKIFSLVKGGHLPDIMNFPNGGNIFNNILYYDENTEQFLQSIYGDSDKFERVTPGAFILCTNMDSLKLIRTEILSQIKKDKRITFNMITTGSTCDRIMTFLKEDKDFENCIKHVCVYCKIIENWKHLKDKYQIVDKVCDVPSDVKKFIIETSTEEIKAYPLTKLITYHDYKKNYKERHFEIAKFYGDLTVESYNKNLEKMKEIIEKEEKEKLLKIKNNNKNKLISSFLTFDIIEDLKALDKLIIQEYTRNTFYGDLNKWLMSNKMDSYETVAYFTSRLMFSLNNYGVSNKMYYEKNSSVKRGIRIPYSCLLPYERAKGKIILLSGFTSTTLDERQAKNFSGRNQAIEQYKTKLIFSVIYIINNKYEKGWISNGVNIQNESKLKFEKEILYQPFSFYYVRNVRIDLTNYSADIELETIGKHEILEEKIKIGENIEYNKKEKIMQIEKK